MCPFPIFYAFLNVTVCAPRTWLIRMIPQKTKRVWGTDLERLVFDPLITLPKIALPKVGDKAIMTNIDLEMQLHLWIFVSLRETVLTLMDN